MELQLTAEISQMAEKLVHTKALGWEENLYLSILKLKLKRNSPIFLF